jgi:hypothetical protein
VREEQNIEAPPLEVEPTPLRTTAATGGTDRGRRKMAIGKLAREAWAIAQGCLGFGVFAVAFVHAVACYALDKAKRHAVTRRYPN